MGMVFQNYAVWPHMSVLENVAFGLAMPGSRRAETTARVDRMLDAVGLEGLEDGIPASSVGGQQQRVALARSLVVSRRSCCSTSRCPISTPSCASACAPRSRALQRRTGMTFIYVTHDQAEAMALSDRIAVFHSGMVQQVGRRARSTSGPRTCSLPISWAW